MSPLPPIFLSRTLRQPYTDGMTSSGQWRVCQIPRGERYLLLVLAILLLPAATWADTFRLASGGEIQGEWLNSEETPLHRYVIRQSSGLILKLSAGDVREHLRESPAQREYEELAPTFPDTAEGQWKLAEWCREHGLSRQRRSHLARIIELDPGHQGARALLGYAFVDGRWTTQQDYHRADGYEFYRGRWRTSQEIELLEARARREQAEKAWLVRLVRLRTHLGTDKAAAATETMAAIKDPAAVAPLGTMLSRERLRGVKMLYIDALAAIETQDAVQVLVRTSLSDSDEEIFHYCLDQIMRLKPPHIADSFIAALHNTSNPVVNRAAAALGRIEDPSAIAPLIDALITVHQRTLPSKISPDATAASFSADGGTMFIHNDGPRVIVARIQNQQVLETLSSLSGVTFGYDQKAWRLWYDQERRAQAVRQDGSRLESEGSGQ